MIIELTKEQANFIKGKLPSNYILQRKSDILRNIDSEPISQLMDESTKCKKIIDELKKTDSYRLLTSKDCLTTFNSLFQKFFQKHETSYQSQKTEYLQKITFIFAKFYKDTIYMFNKSKICSNNKETIKAIEELEIKFKILFEPYQKKCQEELNKQLAQLLSGEIKNKISFKKKQPIEDIEKKEVIEKLGNLAQHQFKQIIKFLNIQIIQGQNEYIIDLDKLDIVQFRKLQSFVKRRIERKRLSKQCQKYCREYNLDLDDYSYQSFLSDSNELQ